MNVFDNCKTKEECDRLLHILNKITDQEYQIRIELSKNKTKRSFLNKLRKVWYEYILHR